MALSSNYSSEGIELLPINKQQQQPIQQSSCLTLTPKMKRANVGKKLQFSTPECSVTPISALPGSSNRVLVPSRKREEAMVMANLRKRVAAIDLSRITRRSNDDSNANDTGQLQQQHMLQQQQQELLDNRPLLPKVSSKRDIPNGEESPKSPKNILQDKDFILDCLCWHNEYRARHGASALTVSAELCEHAQQWANHLGSTNEFYYRSDKNLGQNLFCCPVSALVTDLTGQEVAAYWYSTVRRYNYFKEPHLLHTNVNAGHFTQMVWANSKYFGIGKASSKTGKIFVVAYYFPKGNTVGVFHHNVLPPLMDILPPPSDFDNNTTTSSKK